MYTITCGRVSPATSTACALLYRCIGFSIMAMATHLFAEDETMPQQPVMHVRSCDDFAVTGQGDSPQWERATWVPLNRRPGGSHEYQVAV